MTDKTIVELREELALLKEINTEYNHAAEHAAKSKQKTGDLAEDHPVSKALDLMQGAFKEKGKTFSRKSYDDLCEDAAARSAVRTLTMTL